MDESSQIEHAWQPPAPILKFHCLHGCIRSNYPYIHQLELEEAGWSYPIYHFGWNFAQFWKSPVFYQRLGHCCQEAKCAVGISYFLRLMSRDPVKSNDHNEWPCNNFRSRWYHLPLSQSCDFPSQHLLWLQESLRFLRIIQPPAESMMKLVFVEREDFANIL